MRVRVNEKAAFHGAKVPPGWVEFVVTENKELIGQLLVQHDPPHVAPDGRRFGVVTAINVKPTHQRRGIGTKLYTAATRYLAKKGLWFGSDVSRSRMAEGFWAKQATKGRAMLFQVPPDLNRYDLNRYVLNEKRPTSLNPGNGYQDGLDPALFLPFDAVYENHLPGKPMPRRIAGDHEGFLGPDPSGVIRKLKLTKLLGKGLFAIAFLGKDGKAYKFTVDKSDAFASARLMKSKSKVHTKIFSVRKCSWVSVDGDDVYLIVSEALWPTKYTKHDFVYDEDFLARLQKVGKDFGSERLSADMHGGNVGLRVKGDPSTMAALDLGMSGSKRVTGLPVFKNPDLPFTHQNPFVDSLEGLADEGYGRFRDFYDRKPDESYFESYTPYYGRRVIWLGQEGEMFKVPRKYAEAIEGNTFDADKLAAVRDYVQESGDRVIMFPGYAQGYKLTPSLIAESLQYADSTGREPYTTGDPELDEALKDQAYGWKKAGKSQRLALTDKTLDKRLQQAVKRRQGDLGEWAYTIRDGNHRAFGALLAGEPYVYVRAYDNDLQDFREGKRPDLREVLE